MTDKFQYVREHVREVPDFPKKGLSFVWILYYNSSNP